MSQSAGVTKRYDARRTTHLTRNLVLVHADEIHSLIEMHLPKLRFLDHSMIELALEVHHEMQHLVVGSTGEENLAGVELVERAADGPHVDGVIVGETEDCRGGTLAGFANKRAGVGPTDFGSSVETGHQIRCNVRLVRITSRSQIADF